MSSEAPVAAVVAPAAVVEKVEAPGFKVFAGNLAYTTTDEGLTGFFAPVKADILTSQVILRGTRSAGYGFVAMKTAEAAKKAVELLHEQELDGRKVIVEVAKPAEQKDQEKKTKRKPGRRGSKAVPGELSEAEANGDAPRSTDPAAAGTDEAAKPKKKKKARKPRRKTEEGETSTDAAAVSDAARVDGEPRKAKKVKTPRAPRPAGEDPVGELSKTMLFVANLGFTVDDAQLSTLFTEAGINVVSARVVRRRWGQPRKSKGYGFVDVGSEEEQKKAITALEGKEIAGRQIACKVAINTPHDEDEDAADEIAAAPDATAAVAPVAVPVAAPAAAVIAV